MSLITRNAKVSKYDSTIKVSQNLPKRSLGDVLSSRHPNHFVLVGTDSSRPPFEQIEMFSILTVWLYISTVSTFLNIRASSKSASSGFRLLGEIPAGAIMVDTETQIATRLKCYVSRFFLCFLVVFLRLKGISCLPFSTSQSLKISLLTQFFYTVIWVEDSLFFSAVN